MDAVRYPNVARLRTTALTTKIIARRARYMDVMPTDVVWLPWKGVLGSILEKRPNGDLWTTDGLIEAADYRDHAMYRLESE